MWRKWNLHALLRDSKLVQPLWETVWRLLKKLQIEPPYNSAIPLLGIFPKENKNTNSKICASPCSMQRYSHSQDMEATWVFIDRWVDKEDVIYIQNGILLSYKKNNEILPFTKTWMDLEGIVLSEISQIRTTVRFHLDVESQKQMSNHNKTGKSHRYRAQACGCQRGRRVGRMSK